MHLHLKKTDTCSQHSAARKFHVELIMLQDGTIVQLIAAVLIIESDAFQKFPKTFRGYKARSVSNSIAVTAV
jgi:hypothetical protein